VPWSGYEPSTPQRKVRSAITYDDMFSTVLMNILMESTKRKIPLGRLGLWKQMKVKQGAKT
jgi:hypothetical protein